MMAIVSVVALCAIVFGVVTRFYWAKTRGTTHDTWYHLHIANYIRREHRLPDRVEQFIVPGPYDYPPVLHILLAALPSNVVFRYKWVFAPVVETVHMFLLLALTYWLSGDVALSLVAVSIYATYTTQVVQFTALTPRVLGAFLFTTLVLLVFYSQLTGTTILLVVAILVGVLLLHTHKMSSQTILFLFTFLSFIWLDPIYIGLVGAMVIAAVTISGGHYLTVLQGHLNIINFWRHQHAAGRPPGEFLRRYGHYGSGQDDRSTSPLSEVFGWAKRNEWAMFIADNAWTFFLITVLAHRAYVGKELFGAISPFTEMLAIWAVFIFAFAILTQYVSYFKLVGEGYKYFMWGAFPTAVVLAMVMPLQSNVWAGAVFVVLVIGSSFYGFVRMYLRVSGLESSSRDITTDGAAVLEFLEDTEGDNVLLLPFGMSFHVLHETDHNILFHQNPKLEAESAFPVPIEPLEDIVKDYGIDYVVVDTMKVDIDRLDTEPFTLVFADADYVVFALDK